MSRSKEIRELVHAAKAQGWEVEIDGAGHYRMQPPDGVAASIACTPSDYRTFKNDRAMLRRMGLVLPGIANEKVCLASWHDEEDAAGRFCNHCRGTWKTEEEEDPTEESPDFTIPEEWLNPPEQKETSMVEERSIRAQVLTTLQELNGEFLTTGELAELTGLQKARVGSALRSMLGSAGVERSKRGRYGIRVPVTRTDIHVTEQMGVSGDAAAQSIHEPETEPETELEPQVTQALADAPPDSSKPWRWIPDQGWVADTRPEHALFEATGLTDSRGRTVIRSENGDLFVAVPLVLEV